MCVSCKKRFPKKNLLRIAKIKLVSGDKAWFVDKTFSNVGRGLYVCRNVTCFEKARKSKYLKKKIPSGILEMFDSKIEGGFCQ